MLKRIFGASLLNDLTILFKKRISLKKTFSKTIFFKLFKL